MTPYEHNTDRDEQPAGDPESAEAQNTASRDTDTDEVDATSAGPASGQDQALKRERDQYYDLLLRKTAEFDNYRKRVDRERRELAEFASADLLREFLPIVDNLERALKAASASESVDAYRKGVEIIVKQLNDLLRKRGVTPIDALGKSFDPHLHQAVSRTHSDEHRDGEVLEELERGYMLGDRLLRPSTVRVATRD